MIYYIFDSEQEALQIEEIIINNIKNWVISNNPDALTSDGNSLKGKNAKTGEWDESAITNRWAIPEKTNLEKWVFLKPTQDKVSPIPIEIVLNNITALEEEYDPSWFSFEE